MNFYSLSLFSGLFVCGLSISIKDEKENNYSFYCFFAGEASVHFYSVAGSEFDELFVGTGASRVRQLFGKTLLSRSVTSTITCYRCE